MGNTVSTCFLIYSFRKGESDRRQKEVVRGEVIVVVVVERPVPKRMVSSAPLPSSCQSVVGSQSTSPPTVARSIVFICPRLFRF